MGFRLPIAIGLVILHPLNAYWYFRFACFRHGGVVVALVVEMVPVVVEVDVVVVSVGFARVSLLPRP